MQTQSVSPNQSLFATKKTPDFLQILCEEFEKSKANNPRYSVRAFARKLSINPATLSLILKGKRKIPKNYVNEICDRLKLNPSRRNRFLRSLQIQDKYEEALTQKIESEKYYLDMETHSELVTSWEYFAALSLLELPEQWTVQSVAKRLNITEQRASDVLRALEFTGFVKGEAHQFVLAKFCDIKTTDGVPNAALRRGLAEELKLGIKKLETVPMELRDFSSSTMAIDRSKLPEARNMIRKFRQEMSDLLEDGPPNDVYLLAVQLFPLTAAETKTETENNIENQTELANA